MEVLLNESQRNIGVDWIKTLACIGVCSLHTYLPILMAETEFEIQNLLFYIGALSIPLFFMVNGFLIMRKERSSSYYHKRIFNIFKIVLFSNCMLHICRGLYGEDVMWYYPIRDSLYNLFLQKGHFFAFWFLGTLVMIYLLMLLLKKYFVTKKRILYVILFLIVVQLLVNCANIVSGIKFHDPIEMKLYQPFRLYNHLCYFLLGGVFNYDCIKAKFLKINGMFTILLVVLVSILSAFICNTIYPNYYVECLHCNLLLTFVTVVFFLFFIQHKFSAFISRIGFLLSSCVIIVYIIHFGVIQVFVKTIQYQYTHYGFLILLIVCFISFSVGHFLMSFRYINNFFKL